jgi:WD40 repeat protein/serine/threonine protein kinase
MDMSAERQCPECGAALSADVAIGQCPNCLLSLGLGIPDDHPGVAKLDPTQVQPDPVAMLSLSGAKARTFGDYELLEEIARGGMGVVYRARQRSLNRIVALKMILSGQFASKQEVLRFRSEAEAAANLRHPNIVAIYETGENDGQHYFSMEFVEGRSLAEFGRDGPLPAQRAAHYAQIIAEAIHYAHEQGTLHRDLKPSNVLIDANDQPRVTDFGLAKRIHGDLSLTGSGQVLGSPNYIPPEQACGSVEVDASGSSKGRARLERELQRVRPKIGPYSDVYSLGATLYYLLTGRPPFLAEVLSDTLHQLLNSDPVPPRLLNPSVPLDLQTICMKCLEKEPAKRYPTSQELADELGRFLNDEPIRARPVNRAEKVWRWCRRKPALATLILAVHLVGAIGLAGILWQWRRAETSAANERHEHSVAQGRLYAAQMKLVHAAYKAGKIGGARELLRAQPPDLRGFEWRFLYRLCSNSQSQVLATNASGFASVDFSPDDRTVAFGTGDGLVQIFDLQQRRLVKHWQAHHSVVNSLKFCRQKANWLVSVGGDDGMLKVWDVAEARVLCSTNCAKGILVRVALSPNGKLLAVGAPTGQSLDLWEVQSGESSAAPILSLKTNFPFFGPAEFSPDGPVALCNNPTNRSRIALYDLASGTSEMLPSGHTDYISSLAFSPDGRTLAAGAAVHERVVVWDIKSRKLTRTFHDGETINVTALAFAPDSKTLLASCWDQNIRVWNLESSDQTSALRGHSAGVNGLALSPDGAWLASAGRDRTARLWAMGPEAHTPHADARDEFSALLRADSPPQQAGELQQVFAVSVSPDQSKVAAVTPQRLVVCRLASGAVSATADVTNVFEHGPTEFRSVAFSPDSGTLGVGGLDGWAALLDSVTLQPMKAPILLHGAQITHMAFGLNGRVLISGGGWGTKVKLTDAASGQTLKEITAGEGYYPIQALAVSRDGKLLATGSPDQSVRLWDIESGRLLSSSPQRVRFLHAVTFSPDGKIVAFSDELGSIFLWNPNGRQATRERVAHAGPVNDLAFSPDGRTLASASMDHTVKLWHLDIDQEVATLSGHSGWVWCVAFADDGNSLLSGSSDGSLNVWRALSFPKIEAKEKGGHIGR